MILVSKFDTIFDLHVSGKPVVMLWVLCVGWDHRGMLGGGGCVECVKKFRGP